MKYVRTPGFLIDLRRLPDEHRKLFVQPCMRFSVSRWTASSEIYYAVWG
jgi:hypothetical protein